MESKVVLFSVVVTGEAHNPTILNPDFLVAREIVPSGWHDSVNVTQALTTPPLSMVVYSNGISIVVENEKMQVVDSREQKKPIDSPIVEIACKYVDVLPHVKYKAVGINFHSVITHKNPQKYIKDLFVKPGSWDSGEPALETVGLKLVYPAPDNGRIILSLEAGERNSPNKKEQPVPVIMIHANFHRECQEYPAEQQVQEYIKHVESDWDFYQKLIKRIFQ
ncbi:MAG: hypothetical protein KAH38_09870 [Candidatus Hydrogenedentes bacterium]|nr:hypothetical protein [Candidatus Hydrogenedentota bacterium]